jgi:hypothetical protein
MIWYKNSHSGNLSAELLFIGAVLAIILVPVDVNAESANRDDIKKILFSIKQKYRALSTKQAIEAKQASAASQMLNNNILLQDQNADGNSAYQADIVVDSQSELNVKNQAVNALPIATGYEGRFAVGEELIYSLSIGSVPLGDIFAIKSVLGVKVGLSEFFQLVDFAIDVDIDNTSATGWYISQRNLFTLAITADNTLQVTLNNRQFSIPSGHFLIDDDIYVELTDIADWFTFATTFDEAHLGIELTTRIPFPIEKLLQRRGVQFTGAGFTESVLPLKDSDYQLFSAPLLDMQLSTRFTSSKNPSAYSILSSQDAGYLSSQLFLSGNDANSLTNARLTLSRESKRADLLGPLNMTEYAIGDVRPVNTGGGNTGALGRGFSMSNVSKGLVDNRRINLVGEVQIGWDVELYRNGILLDNLTNVNTGRYEFIDVDLTYGSNDFELVFYGPQGQIERRTESHIVDRNALEDGQGLVQFSVVDINRSVFGVGDSVDDPTLNGLEMGTKYDYGLTDWLSFGLGASLFLPEQGENVQGLSLSTNLALGSYGLINSVFQFGDDVSGRITQQYNFRTKVADVALGASYRQSDTLSKGSLQGVPMGNDTLSLNMSGRLFSGGAWPVSYENTWDKIKSTNGGVTERLKHSIGMNTRWGSFTHSLVWQRDVAAGDNGSALTTYDTGGSVSYKKRIGSVFTQVFARYQIKPVSELTFIGSNLNYAFSNQLNSQFFYSYDVGNKNSRYDLRLNWHKDAFTFSGGANYDSNDNWSVNLGVRFGLGYDAATDTLFTSGRSLGDAGAVVVRMFEDENLDQQYTEGETMLDNVSVRAVQSFRQENTSKEGIAILKSLTTLRSTDIVVDAETFSEPSMMVSNEGFAVAARRGLLQQFDIPVVKGGELDGVIYIRDEDGLEEAAPYVRLSLVNGDGDVISSTRSEYDGYYLFKKIFPGSYQIQVDTSTGRQRGTTPERLKQVNISNRGDLIIDVDLVLRQLKSVDGYIATVGEFSSLDFLKVYFKLLSERVESTVLSQAFYIETKESSRYLLGAKYVEGQSEEAQQEIVTFCQELQVLDVDCKTKNVEFEY